MSKNSQNRINSLSTLSTSVGVVSATEEKIEPIQDTSGASGEAIQTSPEVKPVATVESVISKQIEVSAASAPSAPVTPYFESLLEKVEASGSQEERRVVAGLQNYMVRMKPGMPVGIKEGAQAQVMFWNLLLSVIERSGEDFNACLSIILAFFDKYKEGVFHDRYALRFMEHVTLDAKQRTSFAALLNLLRLTADPQSRKAALSQVDLKRTMDKSFSEKGRQRVMQFFAR